MKKSLTKSAMTQKKPSPLDIGQTREIVGTPFILRRNCFKSLTENSSCLAVEECIRSMPTLWGGTLLQQWILWLIQRTILLGYP